MTNPISIEDILSETKRNKPNVYLTLLIVSTLGAKFHREKFVCAAEIAGKNKDWANHQFDCLILMPLIEQRLGRVWALREEWKNSLQESFESEMKDLFHEINAHLAQVMEIDGRPPEFAPVVENRLRWIEWLYHKVRSASQIDVEYVFCCYTQALENDWEGDCAMIRAAAERCPPELLQKIGRFKVVETN